jgi:predicted nucleic acid-binding protein
MAYLIDTGVLLRLVNVHDSRHQVADLAVRKLISQSEALCIATQNIAEFCNVATRPLANNGLGWSPSSALSVLSHEIEPFCTTLPEPGTLLPQFKRLIEAYSVVGKQVHDCRLVALMLGWQIGSILTFNASDFRRYDPEGLHVVTPESLIASP